jgi:hypothetical protein
VPYFWITYARHRPPFALREQRVLHIVSEPTTCMHAWKGYFATLRAKTFSHYQVVLNFSNSLRQRTYILEHYILILEPHVLFTWTNGGCIAWCAGVPMHRAKEEIATLWKHPAPCRANNLTNPIMAYLVIHASIPTACKPTFSVLEWDWVWYRELPRLHEIRVTHQSRRWNRRELSDAFWPITNENRLWIYNNDC